MIGLSPPVHWQSQTKYVWRHTCNVCITDPPWAVSIGTMRPLTSVRFQNDEGSDEVALPLSHIASGSAELSSDYRPTNAYSLSSKLH